MQALRKYIPVRRGKTCLVEVSDFAYSFPWLSSTWVKYLIKATRPFRRLYCWRTRYPCAVHIHQKKFSAAFPSAPLPPTPSLSCAECALRVALVRADPSAGGVRIIQQEDGSAVRQPVPEPVREVLLDARAPGKTSTNVYQESGGGSSQSLHDLADGAGGSEGLGRSRTCRRRSSGYGIPNGATAAPAMERESLGADTSNGGGSSNGGSVGTEEGAGGGSAVLNEEIFTWVCAVCSGSGRERPLV